MSKLLSFCGLVSHGYLYLVFLLINQTYGNSTEYQSQPISAVGRPRENPDEFRDADDSFIVLGLIQQVLDSQRRSIREEMAGYQYPNGRYNISANKLDDLVLEKGGRPIRSIIISTWRSGSTFLGDIFAAHPGNFYHFEPLVDFGFVRIRGPPLAAQGLKNVTALLNCEYADLDHYIEYERNHSYVFHYNVPLWRQCESHKNICYDHRFLSGMCKLFPFQSMKLNHLRLQVAQELLADEQLGVRLVLSVRDPRGIIQSRKHRTFCKTSPDCLNPALLCADMVSDYNVAVELQKKYPNTFRVIRYEDVAVEPYRHVAELTKFYGLDFHPNIKNFLDTHTKNDVGGPYSTYRNSTAAPFHWRTDLEFQEVKEIERSCTVAMNRWGYVPAMNATHLREFNPVTNFTLSTAGSLHRGETD